MIKTAELSLLFHPNFSILALGKREFGIKQFVPKLGTEVDAIKVVSEGPSIVGMSCDYIEFILNCLPFYKQTHKLHLKTYWKKNPKTCLVYNIAYLIFTGPV